jgi:hypothetical protein
MKPFKSPQCFILPGVSRDGLRTRHDNISGRDRHGDDALHAGEDGVECIAPATPPAEMSEGDIDEPGAVDVGAGGLLFASRGFARRLSDYYLL